MSELLNIDLNENQEPVVSGRKLHGFLEVGTPYDKWFPRMCDYGFVDGIDFSTFLSESSGGRPATEHLIKIDMAKELCMIQRTEKGKQARQYFIQVEKEYNSPEKIMARALRIAEKELSSLRIENEAQAQKIKEDKPKVLFADAVSASSTSILIGDLAKLLNQNGYNTGQKRLFEQLRKEGYLIKAGSSRNMPSQTAIDKGLFEVKETTISNPDGSIRVTKTTKVTGKGQQYFINKYLGANNEAFKH